MNIIHDSSSLSHLRRLLITTGFRFSSRRKIFPLAVFGISAMNSTPPRSFLYGATRSTEEDHLWNISWRRNTINIQAPFTNAWISSGVIEITDFMTTKPFDSSPVSWSSTAAVLQLQQSHWQQDGWRADFPCTSMYFLQHWGDAGLFRMAPEWEYSLHRMQ